MSEWDPTTDKYLKKTAESTACRLKVAENLFDFTLKEKKDIFGSGNLGVIEGGLCDGQKCLFHWVKPHGLRGCACRFAKPSHPRGEYFRDQHMTRCTHNGDHEVEEFGCDGFKSDPDQQDDRLKPAYMKRVYGRSVI